MFARATFPSPEGNEKINHTQTPGTPEAAFGFPRALRSEFFTVNQLLIDNSQSAPQRSAKLCRPTANAKVPSVGKTNRNFDTSRSQILLQQASLIETLAESKQATSKREDQRLTVESTRKTSSSASQARASGNDRQERLQLCRRPQKNAICA